MKTLFKIIVLSCIIIFTSCSKDDETIPDTAITSYSPNHGPKGTIVTLSGVSFGTITSNVNVSVDEINAEIVSVVDTEIRFKIPPRAFKGEIVVTINGEEYSGFEFEYEISDVQVSTFAGTIEGFQDGSLAIAQFKQPSAMVFDSQGNMFVVDKLNHKIRKITPSGMVSTFAGGSNGFSDGVGANAKFNYPEGIVIGSNGNLYVTDRFNYRIRQVSSTAAVSTIAGSTRGNIDGFGNVAKFSRPNGITIDNENNLYVTDGDNYSVRRITPNFMVTTITGSGSGYADGDNSIAKFTNPQQVVYGLDNALYLVELAMSSGNHGVRKVTLNGDVSTITGSLDSGYTNGFLEDARFFNPQGIVTDNIGNIYVADTGNHVIRRISKTGTVTTLAGSTLGFADGDGVDAKFNTPAHLTIDDDYNIYVADRNNHRIRKITQE